jgi:hypothetical protein
MSLKCRKIKLIVDSVTGEKIEYTDNISKQWKKLNTEAYRCFTYTILKQSFKTEGEILFSEKQKHDCFLKEWKVSHLRKKVFGPRKKEMMPKTVLSKHIRKHTCKCECDFAI